MKAEKVGTKIMKKYVIFYKSGGVDKVTRTVGNPTDPPKLTTISFAEVCFTIELSYQFIFDK